MNKRQADSMRYLFEPESFAVIGASRDPSKIGNRIFRNILDGGYRGRLYPVSPAGGYWDSGKSPSTSSWGPCPRRIR